MSYKQDWEGTMSDPAAGIENVMDDTVGTATSAAPGALSLKTYDPFSGDATVMGNYTPSGGGFDLSGLTSPKNLGSTIQGAAAIAQTAASIYDAHNRKSYQDKVFKMEENRIAREQAKQDRQQAAYDKVFG